MPTQFMRKNAFSLASEFSCRMTRILEIDETPAMH